MRLGVVAIARPTFDVPFAEETAARAYANLVSGGHDVVGSPDLMMDVDAVRAAVGYVQAQPKSDIADVGGEGCQTAAT